MQAPRAFVSYSWTSPEHEQWVIDLASALRASGVDVILDKWDLKEGHDAVSFMEKMVADPTVTKVLMISDRRYAEKSDGRKGGVGTEAQIISPEVYASQSQDKFAAVVTELDENGHPCVPTFYKSRIHINMSDPDRFAEGLEQVLRWIFDSPLHQKPPLGTPPAFILNGTTTEVSPTAALQRLAIQAVKSGKPNVEGYLEDYFSSFASAIRSRVVDPTTSPFDEAIVADIKGFVPQRNEYLTLVEAICRHLSGSAIIQPLHKSLEQLVPLMFRPPEITRWSDWDFDNRKYLAHELFLYTVATLIKSGRFDECQAVLGTQFYFEKSGELGEARMTGYGVFYDHLRSLEVRGQKTQRVSVHADMLKEGCVGVPVSFTQLMQADLVLHLRRLFLDVRWWPITLLYADRSGAFEIFARSQSSAYFSRIKGLIGTKDAEHFRAVIAEAAETGRVPRYDFHHIYIDELCGAKDVATRP